MSAPPSPDALLLGSGQFAGRSLSFGEIGAKPPRWHRNLYVAGPAISKQASKVGSGELLFWDDNGKKTTTRIPGREIWQVIIPVWSDYHDSQTVIDREGEDDGLRFLWVGGSKKPEKRSLWFGLSTAMREAKAVTINEEGAKIDAGFVALGTALTGQSAPRFYEVHYARPVPGWKAPGLYVPGGRDAGGSNGDGDGGSVWADGSPVSEPDDDFGEPPF